MRISRETRYALTALAVLARRPVGEYVEAREISEVAGVPGPFLAKIFQRLAAGGVLASHRGRGYALPRPAETISVRDVVVAVEGGDAFWTGCIFWREDCDEQDPCPLHFRWCELKDSFEQSVGGITLADVRDQGVPAQLAALVDNDGPGELAETARLPE